VNASIIYRARTPLSDRQGTALAWIKAFTLAHSGGAPSQRELAAGLGIARQTVARLLRALERKKRIAIIDRRRGTRSSIRLLDETPPAPPLLTDADLAELRKMLGLLPGTWRATGSGVGLLASRIEVATRTKNGWGSSATATRQRRALVRFLLMMRDVADRALAAAAPTDGARP
jgi:DNA-binding transcriptional MocR family regulator